VLSCIVKHKDYLPHQRNRCEQHHHTEYIQYPFHLKPNFYLFFFNSQPLIWERRGWGLERGYFLPKSAGISPQSLVSHFTIFVLKE
jgi:hypothetical protein